MKIGICKIRKINNPGTFEKTKNCIESILFIAIFVLFSACSQKSNVKKTDSTKQSDFKNVEISENETSETDSEYLASEAETELKNYTAEYITYLDFQTENESRFIDGNAFNIDFTPNGNYNDIKNKILTERNEFQDQYLKAKNKDEKILIINKAGDYLSETLLNQIFPFWYGMQWSMSGYSEIPNSGEVGCSYFISNTLKHCGFKLNRYKLAQQNSKNIPCSVQTNDNIAIINANYQTSIVTEFFLKNKKEGLYVVGLDCHVGFLLFRKNELIFIHSNYASPPIVMAEFSEKSDVFSSNTYYIADFTTNESLMKKWLMNEEIIVKK